MRILTATAVSLALALTAVGCGNKDESTRDAEAKLRDAERARDDAAKKVQAEYVREANERLAETDAKLKALGDRVSVATGDTKVALQKKYDAAKEKRDAAAKRLAEVKDAAPDRWEKLKDGMGNAWDDLKKSFD